MTLIRKIFAFLNGDHAQTAHDIRYANASHRASNQVPDIVSALSDTADIKHRILKYLQDCGCEGSDYHLIDVAIVKGLFPGYFKAESLLKKTRH